MDRITLGIESGRAAPAKEQFVVFAVPTLSHWVSADHYRSMLATQWLLFQRGTGFAMAVVGGDPYLAKVRSKLVTIFLKNYPQATDLFFLDDDVGFEPEAVVRILGYAEDVVAGVYPKKNGRGEFPVELPRGRDGHPVERGPLLRASLVPTGFLRIKRHVVEHLAAESLTFLDPNHDGTELECYNVFEMGFCSADGKWWGEDYDFCRKCQLAGFEIWVDPDVSFSHRGSFAWNGRFSDALASWKEANPKNDEEVPNASPLAANGQ